jgi:hypothetical protein
MQVADVITGSSLSAIAGSYIEGLQWKDSDAALPPSLTGPLQTAYSSSCCTFFAGGSI